MISRNDACWCGSGKKWKKCHYPEKGTESFQELKKRYYKSYSILVKSKEEIEKIRAACKVTAKILDKLCHSAKKGTTTQQLEELSIALHKEYQVKPATLDYGHPPYPKTICTSLNEVICHGIPDDRPLQDGDILNIDASSILDGYYGDCSRMVIIGEVSEEKKRVVNASYEALQAAISICKPGAMMHEIGHAIEEVARQYNCSVVDQFVGHGVGIHFHEPPQVLHHYNNITIPMCEGMTFTIEPMINAGVKEGMIDPVDGWTARTADGKPSAQWEHTILITKTGHEILTLP